MKKDEKDSENEPKDSEKESKDSDKEPKNSDKQAKDSEQESNDIEKESTGLEKEPKESEKESKDSDKEPKDSDKQPKDSEKESNDLEKERKESEKGANESEKEPSGAKDLRESEKEPENSRKRTEDSAKELSEKESKRSEKSNKKPGKNVQDALEAVLSHVGEMGRYQKILFVFMMPFGLFFAFGFFVQMFITVTPQRYWCTVPELAHLDLILRRNLSAPGAATGKWDHCATFDVNWTQVLKTMTPPAPGTPTVPCRHGWDFELTDIPYHTVVTERGWVCEKSGNVPLAQSMFFAGALLGGLSLGWLADYFGRLPALICANMIGGVGGIMTIFSTGMWDFTLCRFIVGISFDNLFMMPYILVLEYVGPSYRTWVANLSIVFFGMGCLMLPGLALLLKDWKLLLWITSLPMFLVLFAPLVFPESARWYLSRGRVNNAVAVLRKFERINKIHIPDEVMDEFIVAANENKQTDESLLVLLMSVPLRLTMILMLIVYMACSVIFDVLVRMSDAFGLDFFVTFTMTSATEIPSVLVLASLLDIWGRRYLTAGPIALSGLCVLAAMFMPLGIPQASMAAMARFCINMSFNAVVLWTTELLPTAVRASGSATMHMSGYVISILSPYIVYSERVWHQLPLLILFIVALFSSGISMVLPETKGLPMPQTIADGEKLVQEQPMWRKPFVRSKKEKKDKPLVIT